MKGWLPSIYGRWRWLRTTLVAPDGSCTPGAAAGARAPSILAPKLRFSRVVLARSQKSVQDRLTKSERRYSLHQSEVCSSWMGRTKTSRSGGDRSSRMARSSSPSLVVAADKICNRSQTRLKYMYFAVLRRSKMCSGASKPTSHSLSHFMAVARSRHDGCWHFGLWCLRRKRRLQSATSSRSGGTGY